MRQIAHILRKDIRYHWPEILFTLAAVALSAWHEPKTWGHSGLSSPGFVGTAITLLPLLSWWILTVRVIQSEPLAGARQFWITRPYLWKQLLAEKILFILLFVNLPLVISHFFLLEQAGFHFTLALVPGMAWAQLELLFLLILPIIVLATLTANFGQMVLSLLAAAVYIAGVVTVAEYVPNANFSSGTDTLQGAVLFCMCVVVVIVQYARRNTNLSRMLVVAMGVVILVTVVATPYGTLIAHEYPYADASNQQAVQLSLASAKPPKPEIKPDQKETVEVSLPISVAGIQEGSYIKVNGIRLSLESANGQHWDSEWKYSWKLLVPLERQMQLDFELKKEFYERAKSSAVHGHISLALSVLSVKNVQKLKVTDGEFSVPGIGSCSLDQMSLNTLNCRFPVEGPRLAVLKMTSSDTTCPKPNDKQTPTGETVYGWGGNTDSGPFSPVGTFNLHLSQGEGEYSSRLCLGTPIEISIPEVARRMRVEISLNEIQLDQYRKSNTLRFTFQ